MSIISAAGRPARNASNRAARQWLGAGGVAHVPVRSDDKRYALRVNDEFTIDLMPSVAGHSWAEMQILKSGKT